MKKSIAERLKGKIMMMIIEGNRNVEGATIDPIQTIQANQAHQTEGAGIGKLDKRGPHHGPHHSNNTK